MFDHPAIGLCFTNRSLRRYDTSGMRKAEQSYRAVCLVLLIILAGGSSCNHKAKSSATSPLVREVVDSGHNYGLAEVDLDKSTIRPFWKRPDGSRIGTFAILNDVVAKSGDSLIFATNAGIFDTTFSPSGLFVKDGREIVPLNLKNGIGNFFMKPNGVFLVDDKRAAAIVESSGYLSLNLKPSLAVQSGPLLLIHGQINSKFAVDSTNRRIRSAVGIVSSSRVVFVLSRDRVTFYELAAFFRDQLKCQDALYLDGEISRFYPDAHHPSDRPDDFAGMFAVTARE
jgi:uncharacterized protein YigE (DUF2233 family)